MNIELINTGTELMLGFVLNTHHQWIGRQLADAGYEIARQVAVPDAGPAIEQAVREALSRADVVIVTGGLGPTSDDVTRELIASLLGRKLRLDPGILAKLEEFFSSRSRPMPESNKVQAQVPDGAVVLDNPHGTAPGLAMEVTSNPFRPEGKTSWLFMLPGPPRELRPMFTQRVLPMLREKYPLKSEFICRTLKTTGIGESALADKIAGPLEALAAAGLEVGYCAHTGAVDVRLVARGERAAKVVWDAETIVRERIGKYIFGTDGDELNAVIVRLLTERKQTLALAESCTGGYVANRITDVPGASVVLLAGLVTYSNEAKQSLLGVKAETIAAHGAVSEPTAREMAAGARAQTGADYAIAITGIAGPSGGSPEKPVGTVFIALATAKHVFVINPINRYDRESFKHVTFLQALELLRRTILGG